MVRPLRAVRRQPLVVSAFVASLVVISLLGVAATGTAAPPPRPLCDACGESFEATAESHGVAVAVERSTATAFVGANGTATWVVRNRLADAEGRSRLRANASLRTDIADRAMWDAELRSATVSPSGVLTMRYREPDFAERSVAGVRYSGEFTETHGYRNLDGLGADRLVVVAPDGTTVGWTVPGATVSDDGRRMTLTRFEGRGFVTFVPENTALGPVLSVLALGVAFAPAVTANAVVGVAVPAAAFALLVAAVGTALGRFDRAVAAVGERVGVALAALGVLVTGLALLASGGVSLFGGAAAPVFGAGVTAVAFGAALSRPAVRERVTYRRLLAAAAVGVALAAGTTLTAAVAFDQNGLTYSLLTSLPALVSVLALFPAGYALGRGDRRLAAATAAVGFALSVLPFASLVWPRTGPDPFYAVFVVVYAGLLTVVGTPLLVAGLSLGVSAPADGAT